MKLFRTDNTDGYTDSELAKLNDEWNDIVDSNDLEEFTDEYNTTAKEFSDAVSKRYDGFPWTGEQND